MPQNSILLIDPFKAILNAYRMVLEHEEYLVETSENLEEAFRRFSIKQHSVIITEYLLPSEDTHRMIQWVKRNSIGTYIIMVTNVTIDESEYETLFDVGLDDLILKPFSPRRILVHIKKGLRNRELILKKQELERQSTLDPITEQIQGLIFNDIFFKKCLRQEVRKAQRHQHPLSLLLIQIPNIKGIGDRIENFCIELVQIVRKYTREEDMVGRYNGAYGIILPETDQLGSETLAQRLSNLIQGHSAFKSDEALKRVTETISFQAFTYPDNFSIPESLKIGLEEKRYPYH
jgi:diguanylate cyclase (GGDEF)-like protein